MMKKLWVVGIIVLFIGVGIQPVFANDNNIIGNAEQQNVNYGITYVPDGNIDLSGSTNTVTGGLFGDTIKLSGSDLTITPI